jgi:hypothetical protein
MLPMEPREEQEGAGTIDAAGNLYTAEATVRGVMKYVKG